MRKSAHEDQRAGQIFIVFLDKVAVVIICCTLELVVELDAGVAVRPEDVWEDSLQCFKQSILQAENDGKKRD